MQIVQGHSATLNKVRVSGDILLTKAQAIAHGVGPDDHFTNGLALALREQWPSMPKDFRHWSHLNHPKPGAVWMWGGVGNHRIFCLLTQDPTGTHGHGGKEMKFLEIVYTRKP